MDFNTIKIQKVKLENSDAWYSNALRTRPWVNANWPINIPGSSIIDLLCSTFKISAWMLPKCFHELVLYWLNRVFPTWPNFVPTVRRNLSMRARRVPWWLHIENALNKPLWLTAGATKCDFYWVAARTRQEVGWEPEASTTRTEILNPLKSFS